MSEILLDVKNLKKYFKTNAGMLHAVDDVSFSIEKGHTMGVVGESGCGKSTLGRTLLQLYETTSGEIDFKGKNIANLSKKEFHQVRPKLQAAQIIYKIESVKFLCSLGCLRICFCCFICLILKCRNTF